jgi:hypothetical protein
MRSLERRCSVADCARQLVVVAINCFGTAIGLLFVWAGAYTMTAWTPALLSGRFGATIAALPLCGLSFAAMWAGITIVRNSWKNEDGAHPGSTAP